MPELFPKAPDQKYPNPISVEAINQLLHSVPRVITGSGVQMKRIGDRFIIEHVTPFAQSGPQIQNFLVMDEQEDYLNCVIFDFVDVEQSYDPDQGISLQELGLTGTVIKVAKPYWLQQTPFEGKVVVVDGAEVTITHLSSGQRKLINTTTGQTTIQALAPSYFAGDVVSAFDAQTSLVISGDPVSWTDLNTAARRWASDVVSVGTIELWFSARIADSSITKILDEGIESVTRTGPGLFVVVFDDSFVDEDSFTWAGSIGNDEDTFFEVSRTPISVTIQTKSGVDPADRFGIIVKGKIGEPIELELCGMCEEAPLLWCVRFNGMVPITSGPGPFCADCVNFDEDIAISYVGVSPSNNIWGQTQNCCNRWVSPPIVLCEAFDDPSVFGYYHVVLDVYLDGFDVPQVALMIIRADPSVSDPLQWGANNSFMHGRWMQPLGEWDCLTQLALPVVGGGLGFCSGNPPFVALIPNGCVPVCSVTVAFNDENLSIDATELTIFGTGFDSATPGNNIVTLNLGAACTVTAATSTSLTASITTPPSGGGALTAIVVVGSCDSGDPVQVATVVDNITRTPKGSDNIASGLLTVNLTIDDDSLLIVNVGVFGDFPTSIEFNGVPLTAAALSASGGGAQTKTGIYYLHVVSGVTADLEVDFPAAGMISIVQVNGLVDFTVDQTQTASDSSGSATPDIGATPTTAEANEYVQSAITLKDPGGTPPGTWQNSYTSGGQDENPIISGHDAWLIEGYRVLSTTDTPDGELSGVTSIFSGATATFS